MNQDPSHQEDEEIKYFVNGEEVVYSYQKPRIAKFSNSQ